MAVLSGTTCARPTAVRVTVAETQAAVRAMRRAQRTRVFALCRRSNTATKDAPCRGSAGGGGGGGGGAFPIRTSLFFPNEKDVLVHDIAFLSLFFSAFFIFQRV